MIDLTYSLETIKDALHEKVISINSAINRTIDNVKIRNMLIQRRNKFQNLLDEIKDGISKDNTIVMLTADEMKKVCSDTQVSDHTSNSNEKQIKELEKMCRTLHLDKLGMLNQTLGSIRNSDYNLLDEETKQLANKLYDSLSKKLPK